jgi:hypothetical protein
MTRSFRRLLRAARLVVRDQRIPRPLRWLAAIALMPIPGPVDEAALLVLAPLLFAFHREPMREAWRAAMTDTPRSAPAV